MKLRFLLLLFINIFFTSTLLAEVLIDQVVASVDGEPITLNDVRSKAGIKNTIVAGDINSNPEIKKALEQLIIEQVITHAAKQKNIKVAPQELDQYLQSLAARNGMSLDEFRTALKKEGQDIKQLKSQVKMELLRSKMISQMTRDGVSVSDKDLDELVDEDLFTETNVPFVVLRQILVNTNGQTPGVPESRVKLITEQLGVTSFPEVAKRYSDGPEAKDGGLVGLLPMSELSELIQDSVAGLTPKTPSSVVQSFSGYHIFYLDAIYEDVESARSAYMKMLKGATKQDKLQEHIARYFQEELPKNHVIEELF